MRVRPTALLGIVAFAVVVIVVGVAGPLTNDHITRLRSALSVPEWVLFFTFPALYGALIGSALALIIRWGQVYELSSEP